MGEILLCNEPIAALPYYIEGIAWNVYSLEELCYYIENNTYLLEKDFMVEELCIWISQEIKNGKLAEKLRDIMRNNGHLSDFLLVLLRECGYCCEDIIQRILQDVREMEGKSDFECNKIRADRLMEKERYLSCIYEYKRLLASNEAETRGMVFLGSIWHNLGTAYARLFLFKEAAGCYEKAYLLNGKKESLHACLSAYLCLKDENGKQTMIEKYQVPSKLVELLEKQITEVTESAKMAEFEKTIEELSQMSVSEKKGEYQKKLSQMMFQWKEEYRRICRI